MTLSAFGVDDYRISKALLPKTDKDRASSAQARKKAGLGTAGVGYLAATRGKEIASDAAELVTRGPKKIGHSKHFDRVARRTAMIRRGSSRAGVAAVIGGLALAGEGTVSDLKHRHVLDRDKRTIPVLSKAVHVQMPDGRVGAVVIPRDRKEKKMDAQAAGLAAAGGGSYVGGALALSHRKPKVRRLGVPAMVAGGGLAAAGIGRKIQSGAHRDARTRKVVEDAIESAKAEDKPPMAKAYTPGEISYHNTQSQIHSRKATAADRRQRRGSAVVGAGLAGGTVGYKAAPAIARQAGRMADKTETYTRLTRAARSVPKVRRAALIGGAATVAAGVGMNAEGAITASQQRKKKAAELSAVQDARRRRNAAEGNGKRDPDITKAYDRKADKTAGGIAATGLVGGAGVAAGARHAERRATGQWGNLQQHLIRERRLYNAEEQARGMKISANIQRSAKVARHAGPIGAAAGVIGGVGYLGLKSRPKRDPDITKAFDSERQRHKRADLYEGAAAGGSLVAGSAAAGLAGKSVKLKLKATGKTRAAASNRAQAAEGVRQMGAKEAPRSAANLNAVSRRLRTAAGQEAVARKARIASRALSGGAGTAAAGAAALGAAAYGIHHQDRKGSGRSYGY